MIQRRVEGEIEERRDRVRGEIKEEERGKGHKCADIGSDDDQYL